MPQRRRCDSVYVQVPAPPEPEPDDGGSAVQRSALPDARGREEGPARVQALIQQRREPRPQARLRSMLREMMISPSINTYSAHQEVLPANTFISGIPHARTLIDINFCRHTVVKTLEGICRHAQIAHGTPVRYGRFTMRSIERELTSSE